MRLAALAVGAAVVTGGARPGVRPRLAGATSPPQTASLSQTALPATDLVFDSDRTGQYEIYAMPAAGGAARALTADPRFDSWWARVAPDRRRILFYRTPRGVHDRDFTRTALWVMNADGSAPRELRPAGADGWALQGHAEWSPDGAQLVMFGGRRSNPQIYVTDAEGRAPRAVTARGGTNLDPSWAPDGRTIHFVGCPHALCFPTSYEVYATAAEPAAEGGDGARRLTHDGLRDHDPYAAPDGRHIAWLTQTSRAGAGGVWNIRTADADGSAPRWVTDDGNINSKPEWAADGGWLYFHRLVVGRDRHFHLAAIRPDGTGLHELTTGGAGGDASPDAYNDEYPGR